MLPGTGRAMFAVFRIDHSVQMRCGIFDVEVLVLARPHFYGDGYVGRLEIGIPSEFSLHVSFDFTIGFHGLTPQLLAPRVAGSKLYIQRIRGKECSLWLDCDRLTRQVLGFHSIHSPR